MNPGGRKTNFTIIEASRDDVLAQKRKDPDPKEAFRYYQVGLKDLQYYEVGFKDPDHLLLLRGMVEGS